MTAGDCKIYKDDTGRLTTKTVKNFYKFIEVLHGELFDLKKLVIVKHQTIDIIQNKYNNL